MDIIKKYKVIFISLVGVIGIGVVFMMMMIQMGSMITIETENYPVPDDINERIESRETHVVYELSDLKTDETKTYERPNLWLGSYNTSGGGNAAVPLHELRIEYEGHLSWGTKLEIEFEMCELSEGSGSIKLFILDESGIVLEHELSEVDRFKKTYRVPKSGNYAIITYHDQAQGNYNLSLQFKRF